MAGAAKKKSAAPTPQPSDAAAEPRGPGAARRAGRAQDPERGAVILAVTLEILEQRGYAGLTVGEIVARARVSRSTIYRRWPTKEELVIAAFDRLPHLEVVERGDLIDELVDLFGQYNRLLHSTPLGTVLPGLISEAARNRALAVQLNATIQERRKPGLAVLARAVERGDLPAGVDLAQANEMIMALLVQRSLFEPDDLDPEGFRGMIEIIVAGLNSSVRRTS